MTLANPTSIAFRPAERTSLVDAAVLRRAAIVALVLGSILTLANQTDALFGDAPVQILPLLLVYLTPFVVVTISQVLGMRRARYDAGRDLAHDFSRDTFARTALSHGIPLRALLVGLAVGSVNTAIVLSAAWLERGSVAGVPSALIAQAYILPMLFGLLSQAISYRRAARAVSV